MANGQRIGFYENDRQCVHKHHKIDGIDNGDTKNAPVGFLLKSNVRLVL